MYSGHIIAVTPQWLKFATSRGRPMLGIPASSPYTSVGDPVFFVPLNDSEQAVHLFARVASRSTVTVAWALANWAESLGNSITMAGLFVGQPQPSLEEEVRVLCFDAFRPVDQPLALGPLGIHLPCDTLHIRLDPKETLAMLAALPPASQTPWTQRVVLRRNDLD